MTENSGIAVRWQNFKATKGQVAWACAASVGVVLIVGFGWGGWVTGQTASTMVSNAASEARADLAATLCVQQFANGADAVANLATLKGAETWKRGEFIERGGWVTLAGVERPVSGAATLCARMLLDAKLPAAIPAKTAG